MTPWSVKKKNARDYKVKYIVATSAFFIYLCQEVVVKGFRPVR